MSFRLRNAYRERYVPVAVAASSALELPELTAIRQRGGTVPQIEVTANGADTIVAFGGSGVTANNTVDGITAQRDAGMYMLKDGAVMIFELPDSAHTHVSTLSQDGTSTGNVIMRFGNGEL